MYSEVTDKKEKTHSVSYYGYDAFGRRILEQDKDEAALRSVYDGFTFDVIKQSPTFANGLFVDSNEIGIRISRTGRPTGDRYRYLEDNVQQDNNRYFHLDEGNYRNVSSRYKGSRTTLTVNGTIAGQNADGEVSYFTTDLLGTVRTTTDGYGYTDKTYSYDAFGAIIEGDLSSRQNYGYLGKQFDKQTGLYNYGYRDYTPKVARFTTVDPIRDGENWVIYCRNDSVNFVDFLGLDIGQRTTDYRMSDKRWGNQTTGNGVEKETLSHTGCAVTEESNVISSATGKTVTPYDINKDKTNFAPGTDLLNMQKVAEDNGLTFDYWTSGKQGDLGNKITELSESSTEYYISAQVKYNPDGNLHWVGVTDVEKRDDGNTYIKIAPSSVHDIEKINRARDSWVLDENGDMWVLTTDINKIYTYEKNKNK